jgi:hypothetical protein
VDYVSDEFLVGSMRDWVGQLGESGEYVLGFFMVSIRARDGFLSPFFKNITMDLSSTSRMIFLML